MAKLYGLCSVTPRHLVSRLWYFVSIKSHRKPMTKNTSSLIRQVSAVAVVDLANELHRLAVIDDAYLKTMGVEFTALNAAWKEGEAIQERRLPEHLLLGLWAEANKPGTSTYIGLNIGSKVNNQARGLLANWLFQCSTVAEAFETFSNNIHLLNPSEHWEKVNKINRTKLHVHFKSEGYPSIAIDRSMAAIVSWGSSLIGSDIKPASASFTRPEPNCSKPYEEIFDKNIRFIKKRIPWFFRLIFLTSQLKQPTLISKPCLRSSRAR